MNNFTRINLGLLVVVLGYLFYHIHLDQLEKEDAYRAEQVMHLEAQYLAIKKAHEILARTLFNTLVNQANVLEIVADAHHGDAAEQDRARDALLALLGEPYAQLRSFGVRQLHFHTVDNHSFLRFHRPGLYGDDLTGIRFSIEETNKLLKPVSGFEEGRIFNGFRNLFPLFYKGEHIGSVEISFSFAFIRDYLNEIFPATYNFILKKSVVDEKLFKSQHSNYVVCEICKNYVFDRDVLESNPPNKLGHEQRMKIKRTVAHELAEHAESGNSFSLETVLDDTYYALTFLTIKNLQGQHVAYIVSIRPDNAIKEMRYSYRKNQLILGIVALMAVILVYLQVLRRRHQDASQRANLDYLTQSYNRQNCQERLEALIEALTSSPHEYCMLLLDLDHFKKVNDTFGHDTGDRVLVELVGLIKQSVRSSDTVCRWGGEEFIIVVQSDLDAAERIAQKVRTKIASHAFEDVGHMSVSIGMTKLHASDTEKSCFKRADVALYKAKENGRDRVVVFEKSP